MDLNLDAKTEREVRGGSEARRTAASSKAKTSPRPVSAASESKSAATETELKSRLERTFDKIADSLRARGDDELATVVEEDGQAMSQGLVSLTKPFKQLRTVLFFFLAFVEPLLAFGRVFRVLAGRFADRRAARHEPQTESPDTPQANAFRNG